MRGYGGDGYLRFDVGGEYLMWVGISWFWIWDFNGCDLGFAYVVWFGVPIVFQRWCWCLVGLVF